MSDQTWNDNFELPDGYSVSNIQDYLGFIIKKHEVTERMYIYKIK